MEIKEYLTNLLSSYGCRGITYTDTEVWCQCPFHWNRSNFKTFSVNYKEVTHNGNVGYFFYCYSCGESGSIYKLISHIERCGYKKSVKILNKETDIGTVSVERLLRELSNLNNSETPYDNILKEISMPNVAVNQKPLYDYLHKRSRMHHRVLKVDYSVKKHELYYCDKGREAGRIIFPIRSVTGECVCFNDRSIRDNIKAKSLNIKGLPYGKLLLGMDYKKNNNAIIVEGVFDKLQVECALLRYKHHKKYTVLGMMGTYMTDERIKYLVKYYNKVILFFDNDDAGRKATERAYKTLSSDIDTVCATELVHKGKDPGKCTVKEIKRAVLRATKPKRRSYINYLAEKIGMEAK